MECKKLKQLGLSACIGITNKGFSVIVEYSLYLLALDLSGSHNLTDDGAIYLVEHSSVLKLLDLRKCEKLSDDCISHLRQNKKGLRVLFIRAKVETLAKREKTIEKVKPKCVQKFQVFRKK
jgi:F-box/leucine-rich repeat protein 2/20